MRLRILTYFASFVPFTWVACTASKSAPTAPTEALPCGIATVLQERCQACHSNPPQHGAPMPLVTFADLHASSVVDPSQEVYQRIEARIHDDSAPMPPPPAPRLDQASASTLDTWIASGAPPAPAGAACMTAPTGPDGGMPGGGTKAKCIPDHSLAPPGPIAIPAGDSLFCYGVDLQAAAKRQITSVLPRIADQQLVHHVTLYLADHAEDAAPHSCAANGQNGWRIVSMWTPGAQSIDLPPEAGFPIEGTTHYAVQVHYQNLQGLLGHQDTSGFDLCTTDQLRPNDADVLVFGTEQFDIAPQSTLDITCDYTIPPELGGSTVVSLLPHMHTMGTRIAATLLPESIALATRDPWTYATQYWTDAPPGSVLHPGDRVATRCAWANPSSKDVSYGESGGYEMCSVFTLYYPKVAASGWSWGRPEQKSVCHPSP
jgi:hypothetical protein